MPQTTRTVVASPSPAPLAAGTRVLVYGQPGVVRYTTADGAIGVNLDGEGKRIDEWSPEQVDLDECANCGGSTAPGTSDPHECAPVPTAALEGAV